MAFAIASVFNATLYVPPLAIVAPVILPTATVAPVYAIQTTVSPVNAPQTTSANYYSSQGNIVTNVAGGELDGVVRIGYFSGSMSGSIDKGLIAILGSSYYYVPTHVVCVNNMCPKLTSSKQNPGVNGALYRGPGASVTGSSNGTTIVRAGVGLGGGISRVSNVTIPGDDPGAAGTFGFTIGGSASLGPASCSARCSAGFQLYTNPDTGMPTGVKYFESCKSDCSITRGLEPGLKVEGDFGVEASKNGEVTGTVTKTESTSTSETTSTTSSGNQ